MLQVRRFRLVCWLPLWFVLSSIPIASAQDGQPAVSLPLKAELVLTNEFCATKIKKGSFISGKETFEVGKPSCIELEKALKVTFSGLERTNQEPAAGTSSAQVVLVPKFVDVGATKTLGAFSDRELVILLEWTAKDAAGKPVWIETVQGSGKAHSGNVFTAGRNRKKIVEAAVKELVETSAKKMSDAPELRKVVQ